MENVAADTEALIELVNIQLANNDTEIVPAREMPLGPRHVRHRHDQGLSGPLGLHHQLG